MEKIVKMINGTIHTSGGTLCCEYCYLAQAGYQNDKEVFALRYPLDTILEACSKKRLGGVCFIQIIGDGETLLPKDAVSLILGLLREGHYVQIITNGTLTERLHELVEGAKQEGAAERLLISFSLHFIELERGNWLKIYADNIKYVRENGISFRVSMVCSDADIEAEDRIHTFCENELNGIALGIGSAKKYNEITGNIEGLWSKYNKKEYYEKVMSIFPSYNLEYIQDLDEIDNHKFCYAGSWYFQLDFTTGTYSQCLQNAGPVHNFFENMEEGLLLEPVGTGCRASWCWCGWSKKLNLIPNECRYVTDIEEMAAAPENKYITKECLEAGFADLASSNFQLSAEEKEQHTKKRVMQQYFAKQIELLRFDFKEEKYEAFIKKAEKLLEADLNPRLVDVVWLVVRYGYALIRRDQLLRALDLESCWDDLAYNADYCYVMGLIYMKNDMIEKAVTAFLEATQKTFAMDKGVNDYLAYYNLGVIYECIGQSEEAKRYYVKCEGYEPAKQRLEALGV